MYNMYYQLNLYSNNTKFIILSIKIIKIKL